MILGWMMLEWSGNKKSGIDLLDKRFFISDVAAGGGVIAVMKKLDQPFVSKGSKLELSMDISEKRDTNTNCFVFNNLLKKVGGG